MDPKFNQNIEGPFRLRNLILDTVLGEEGKITFTRWDKETVQIEVTLTGSGGIQVKGTVYISDTNTDAEINTGISRLDREITTKLDRLRELLKD